MKYVPVWLHLPLWLRLKIRGTPTTARRAVRRKTSWWSDVFVFLCPPGLQVRMLRLMDLPACASVTDCKAKWPPNSCVEGWHWFINPARHSETLWLTHTALPWRTFFLKKKKESKKERKINCPRMSLPLFVLTVFCACIIIPHCHSKSEAYVAFVHAKAGQKSIQNHSSIVVVLCHVLHNFPFQIARPQLWNVLFNQLATQFTIKATVVHGREFLRYWNKKSLEWYSLQIILNCDFYYRSNTRITGVIKMY